MEIKDIKNNLDHIRKSREMWNEFAYLKGENSEDVNYMKRYALAIELQYNCHPDDKELVKFLMENEVKSRMNDPWQGCGDSLHLISYLLAKFREPENVWLFEKAKCANFDTYCGYHDEFIFSAGVEATCNYLESHRITEDNGYLFERRDNLRSIYTENDIENFFERMKRWFPDRMEEESITTLFYRAIDFEDYKEGERLFSLLEKEGELDAQSLYYHAKAIKNYDKAIYYQSKHFETVKSIRDKVFSLFKIAEMYCLNGDYMNAFETAKKWDQMLDGFSGWKGTGLGRSLTETWFDISLGFYEQNKRKLALRSFQKGHYMLKKNKNHSLHLLEKANICCGKLGVSSRKRKYYKRLLEAEKKRIEEMFAK